MPTDRDECVACHECATSVHTGSKVYATAGKNKDRNSGNYQQAERDEHIHHPRSFEYRVVLVGKKEKRGQRREKERRREHTYARERRRGETEEKNRVGGREREKVDLRQIVHRYTRIEREEGRWWPRDGGKREERTGCRRGKHAKVMYPPCLSSSIQSASWLLGDPE